MKTLAIVLYTMAFVHLGDRAFGQPHHELFFGLIELAFAIGINIKLNRKK